jgi:NNP family nitrate/nitrite transporter-like MFS transporter
MLGGTVFFHGARMIDTVSAKRANATLFAAFLHFDISFAIWVILGPLALFIAKDLHLSIVQKGFLVSIPPLGGAFFRIILGLLSDRFGAKRVGVASMALTLVPLVIGWLAGTTYGIMIGVGLLLGIAGASFAVSLPLASRWFPPEKQGLAMGIAGAGNSGTVISTLFAPVIAAKIGWHATLAVATIPVLVALVVFTWLATDSPAQPKPKTLADYASVLAVPETWWFCFFYSITFGGFLALVSYLAIYFNTAYGVDKVHVGMLVAAASLAGSVLRPVGGLIADRIGGIVLAPIVLIVFAVGALIVATQPPLGTCAFVVFVMTGALGMGNGAIFQIVPQRFSKEIGIVTGIVGAAGGLGGFYLPNLLSILRAHTGTFASGFITFAGIAIAGAILLALAARSWNATFLSRGRTSFAFALEEA